MMERKHLVILLLVAGILIAGGLLWNYLQADRKARTEGILTEEPCAPPCWQGIVPGTVVDRRTVIRQIRRMPGVVDVRENGLSIRWGWSNWPGYNSIYVEENGVVQSISLVVDFELTVQEIIGKYGVPDATNAGPAPLPESEYAWLHLYYPQHGLHCRAHVFPDYQPILEPESRVHQVVYTVPARSIADWVGPTAADEMSLQPWPDYGQLEGFRP
jgi:hypothetical protein